MQLFSKRATGNPIDKTSKPTKTLLTWASLDQAVLDLRDQIQKEGYKPERIVGVARGGWFPAAMLAFDLQVHDLRTFRIQTYDHHFVDLRRKELDNPETLFVDDIFDSGQTQMVLKNLYPKAKFAVAFYKPNINKFTSFHKPDYLGVEVPDLWVDFPWERPHTIIPVF